MKTPAIGRCFCLCAWQRWPRIDSLGEPLEVAASRLAVSRLTVSQLPASLKAAVFTKQSVSIKLPFPQRKTPH
jgi:hypothetical protein